MRVLQTDDSASSTLVAEELRRAGHEVLVGCLPNVTVQHECRGLHDGICPLDGGADIAIAGVEREHEVASAGVVCSRRHAVPVVNVGRHDVYHPDLVPSLERLAHRGDEYVTWSVQQAMCTYFGSPDHGGSVELDHTADRERIVATVPHAMTAAERADLGVRLLAAATSTGRGSTRRDVIIHAG